MFDIYKYNLRVFDHLNIKQSNREECQQNPHLFTVNALFPPSFLSVLLWKSLYLFIF